MEITTDKIKVSNAWNQIFRREDWTQGSVITRHGIVNVYAQGDDQHNHFFIAHIVNGGYYHTKSVHGKRYTERGLVTFARKFAEELFEGE